jgi:hypothetical protein
MSSSIFQKSETRYRAGLNDQVSILDCSLGDLRREGDGNGIDNVGLGSGRSWQSKSKKGWGSLDRRQRSKPLSISSKAQQDRGNEPHDSPRDASILLLPPTTSCQVSLAGGQGAHGLADVLIWKPSLASCPDRLKMIMAFRADAAYLRCIRH